MTRVLVTGGAGRLGRSVVTTLVGAGHDVTSLDHQTTPAAPCAEIAIDLTDHDATLAAFAEVRPEFVVHLAAIAVPFSAPEHVIFRTNTTIAWNVVEAAVASGATKVLAASSPTVLGYGAPHG